jgi:Mg-chelatase subunit ChlD
MQKYINKKKAILLLAVLALYVVIITPLLVINLQKKQELRGKAQTTTTAIITPGQSCGNVPADIMLIIDRSSSMTGSKFQEAQAAAKSFIDVIASDITTANRIGLVSFDATATLNSGLTNNFASIKTNIDSILIGSGTCHECAVVKANQEISANGRSGVKKVVIMLTDGRANHIIGNPNNDVSASLAESKALTAVMAGFNASQTVFFTIGFGTEGGPDGYNRAFLQKIATSTGGKHYYPAPGELQAVYQEISTLIGKGLLGGFIFNDVNGNGAFDTNEPMFSGWNVQLISQSGTQTLTTDATGSYTITGLCDGNYQLKEILQSGWQQTLPANLNGYSITIANGNSFTDKNFGNTIAPTSTPTPIPTATPIPTSTPIPTVAPTSTPVPTATPIPTPATTFLDLTIYQHGIWNSGDNTNPTGTDLSNKNPVHTTINADLELYNTQNQLIGEGHGPVNYSSTSGNFQGTLEINPNIITSAQYYLKIKTGYHLKRVVPVAGILAITAGQTNIIPAATLVTGDSNNDNKLDILDYNSLLGCYSDLSPAIACDTNKKIATDFNDDGFVNQIDYNLFLREILTQLGG